MRRCSSGRPVLLVEDRDHDRHRGDVHTGPDRMLRALVSARRHALAVRPALAAGAALRTRCLRCCSSRPRCCRATRCRPRTTCGRARRGRRTARRACSDLGSNYEMADAVAAVPAVPAVHARRGCPTCRCGTRTSRAGGRSWPTASRRSSRRSPGRRYCCRSGGRWGSIGGAEAVLRRVRDVPAGPRARACAAAAALLAGLVVRVRAVLRRLAVVAAVERVGVAAVAAAVRPTVVRGPGALPFAGARARRRAAVLRRPPGVELPRARGRDAVRAAGALADPARGAAARDRAAGGGLAAGGRSRRSRCCRSSSCSPTRATSRTAPGKTGAARRRATALTTTSCRTTGGGRRRRRLAGVHRHPRATTRARCR